MQYLILWNNSHLTFQPGLNFIPLWEWMWYNDVSLHTSILTAFLSESIIFLQTGNISHVSTLSNKNAQWCWVCYWSGIKFWFVAWLSPAFQKQKNKTKTKTKQGQIINSNVIRSWTNWKCTTIIVFFFTDWKYLQDIYVTIVTILYLQWKW